MRRRIAAAIAAGALCVACGRSAPQPPVISPPQGAETIVGGERLGWDQRAGDAAELAEVRYAIYVDGARGELTNVACAASATAAGFACTAPLPPLAPGAHVLELASFVVDGGVLESARSAPLTVNVVRASAAAAPDANTATDRVTPREGAAERHDDQSTALPGNVRVLAHGLNRPSDLAFLPDGRLMIAEHSGRIRMMTGGALVREPAFALEQEPGEMLALAVDPEFDRTQWVYAIYTTPVRSGAAFVLARFRESGGTLGDRIVLLDGIAAAPDAHAALRFGPDGKLYAAFDSGGNDRLPDDAASFNGKILRLNRDGTTPDDQPGKTPVLVRNVPSPRGLDWHRASARLWAADRLRVGDLHWPVAPLAIAVRGDDLLVASSAGLDRARIDRRDAGRVTAVEVLLRGVSVSAVAVARDGTIHVALFDAVAAIRE